MISQGLFVEEGFQLARIKLIRGGEADSEGIEIGLLYY